MKKLFLICLATNFTSNGLMRDREKILVKLEQQQKAIAAGLRKNKKAFALQHDKARTKKRHFERDSKAFNQDDFITRSIATSYLM